MRHALRSWLLLWIALLPAVGIGAPEDGPPPRLDYIDGSVSFWRTGAADWAPARVNTPLATDDALYGASGDGFEVQAGARAWVRGAGATQMQLTDADPAHLQFGLTAGRLALDMQAMPVAGGSVEIDTPNGAWTIRDPGYYRFDVDDRGTRGVTRHGGRLVVTLGNSQTLSLDPDQTLLVSGTDNPALDPQGAPAPDGWDDWNFGRSRSLLAAPVTHRLPEGIWGGAELESHGRWRSVPDYGQVWVPNDVPRDWAPYSRGRWVNDPGYGWTWVDDAAWGWAPFHYGRWVRTSDTWAWAPGPAPARPAYAPALVGWLGHPGRPGVGWVALGWGEPAVPWWGRRDVAGRPWWGGWGGPHIVNRAPVDDTVIVRNFDASRIRYANADDGRGVRMLPTDDFARGARGFRPVPDAELRDWQAVGPRFDVRAQAAARVAAEGRAAPPPAALLARPVLATRTAPVEALPVAPGRKAHAEAGSPAGAPPARLGPPPRLVRPGAPAPAAAVAHAAPASGPETRAAPAPVPGVTPDPHHATLPPPPPGAHPAAAADPHAAPPADGHVPPASAHASPPAPGPAVPLPGAPAAAPADARATLPPATHTAPPAVPAPASSPAAHAAPPPVVHAAPPADAHGAAPPAAHATPAAPPAPPSAQGHAAPPPVHAAGPAEAHTAPAPAGHVPPAPVPEHVAPPPAEHAPPPTASHAAPPPVAPAPQVHAAPAPAPHAAPPVEHAPPPAASHAAPPPVAHAAPPPAAAPAAAPHPAPHAGAEHGNPHDCKDHPGPECH